MKKILLAAVSLCLLTVTALGQSSTPRYGTSPTQDNTFRNLSLKKVVIADTAGSTTDTIQILPSKFSNNYQLTVTDSVALSVQSLSSSYYSDRISLVVENTSGANHIVYFTNASYKGVSGWSMKTADMKISLSSGKRAFVQFYFDGTAWVEEYEIVQ